MGTPFIARLEPGKLEGFEHGKPHDQQPPSIPKILLDAMEVREGVFVNEQRIPLENEHDDDDARSCHWVVYASVNKTVEGEVRDKHGNVIQPRKSSTRSTPIGTIRLIPFPHEPHPKDGGHYWKGKLSPADNKGTADSPDITTTATTFGVDRPTSFHDGREPYVRLGRLAVLKEFRGNGLSGLLVQAALSWLRSNPSFFDPSITGVGLEQMGASTETDIPKWGGLVCVHAQEPVIGAWKKWGFAVDREMGLWFEEGIPHVGMFKRVHFTPTEIRI